MFVESRGRLNIATCLVVGSIEDTIRVSVLNVPSCGRWSLPMSRMLRRSVPFHGGIEAAGRSEPCGAGPLSDGSGELVSTGASVGPLAADGDGKVSHCDVSAVFVLSMKMQLLVGRFCASRPRRSSTKVAPVMKWW